MRLAYITTANIPDSWAHSIQIMNMCKAFAQNGAEVTLVVPRRGLALSEKDPFEYYGMERTFSIKKLWCLDLFPGHPSKFFYWLRFISFYISARVYAWFHHVDVVYSRDLQTPFFFSHAVIERHSFPKKVSGLARRMFARARAIVVLTSFIKERLIIHGVAAQKVFVAPDAVDETSFENVNQNLSLETYGIHDTDIVCGYIGTLKTMGMEKGLAYCIEAIESLPENYKLLVVGGELEDIAFYKKTASEKVIFVGKVPHADVPAYAQACNILLAPFPQNEHYSYFMSPLKIFEYMASGRPIITTALPSIEEVLTDGVTAYIVSADESEHIGKKVAEAILSIMKDPVRAERIAQQALAEVKAKYTWRKRAEYIIQSLRSVA